MQARQPRRATAIQLLCGSVRSHYLYLKVSEEKDLGVFITDNLKSARQCQEAYSKASRALGMMARTISYKTKEVLLKLYKSLVRPHLEYCVSAWSPQYVKDKMGTYEDRGTRSF